MSFREADAGIPLPGKQSFIKKFRAILHRAPAVLLQQIYLAWRVASDRSIPMKVRGPIIAALGYVALPFDAVPDMMPGGLTDDFGLLTTALLAAQFFITSDMRADAQAFAARLLASFGLVPGVSS